MSDTVLLSHEVLHAATNDDHDEDEDHYHTEQSITKATVFGYIRLNVVTQYIIPEEIMMLCYDYYGHDFISSTILNSEQRDQLFRLLMQQKANLIPGTTKKVYNAQQDGFDANSFYSKCSGISPSILVIHSNWDQIFGAYTQIAWKFDGGYHPETDEHNTFLFSLNTQHPSSPAPSPSSSSCSSASSSSRSSPSAFVDNKDNNEEMNHTHSNESMSHRMGQIFKIKKRDLEYAVYHGGNGARDLDSDLIFYYGAAAGLLLYENCNVRDDNFAYGGEKCGYHIPKGNMLCGGNKINAHYSDKYEFRVLNFELFTVELEESKSTNLKNENV